MTLQDIIIALDNFNTNEETEDYEITEFFDGIDDSLNNLGELNNSEKKSIIKSFFQYLNRQSSELDENWSFIHLIESIDKPLYSIYDEELMKINNNNPCLTSLVLLNRYTNSLQDDEWKAKIILLKEISQRDNTSELVSEMATEFYEYQLEK